MATTPNSTLNRDPDPGPAKIRSASRLEPGNWALHIKQALLYERRAKQAQDAEQKKAESAYRQRAVQSWGTALANNPFQAWVWFDLGAALTRRHADRDEFLQDVKRADLALEQAVSLRPNDPMVLFSCGRYWLWRSGVTGLEPKDPRRYEHLFQQAITIRPGIWRKVANAVWSSTKNKDAVLASLPQDSKWKERGWRWIEKKMDKAVGSI